MACSPSFIPSFPSAATARRRRRGRCFWKAPSPCCPVFLLHETSRPPPILHDRAEPGYPLIIGGIKIPHDRGCEAHSDGDVLLHCVVDSVLGALGLPDIGQIFPDSDPKWKGAASSVFIKEVMSYFVLSVSVPLQSLHNFLILC